MLPIFEKLEAITVDAADLLNDTDKAACEGLFEIYQTHINFWYPRLQAFLSEHGLYRENTENTDEDPYYSICDDDKIPCEWKNIANSLTERFIRLVEKYFTKTYCLKFSPYKPNVEDGIVIALTSYEPIITNMMEQVGADLPHSGKKEIKRNFQRLFVFERYQPELKGKKIILPDYTALDITLKGELQLSREETSVYILLQTVAVFLQSSPTITEEMKKYYNQWQTEIAGNFLYELTGFSLRFFGNRRIDLCFKNTDTAKRFFDAYQLQTIVALNKKDKY